MEASNVEVNDRIIFRYSDNQHVRGVVSYKGSYFVYVTLETKFQSCAEWRPGDSKMFVFNRMSRVRKLKPKK